jgi:hypothetical protein
MVIFQLFELKSAAQLFTLRARRGAIFLHHHLQLGIICRTETVIFFQLNLVKAHTENHFAGVLLRVAFSRELSFDARFFFFLYFCNRWVTWSVTQVNYIDVLQNLGRVFAVQLGLKEVVDHALLILKVLLSLMKVTGRLWRLRSYI